MTAVYELEIPLVNGREPLNANNRLPWYEKQKRVRMVREAIGWRCAEAGVKPCQHLIAEVHYRPADKRHRDPSNLTATQKPAVDGLVQCGVVDDDGPAWVTERMPVIEEGDGPRRLWLRVEVVR